MVEVLVPVQLPDKINYPQLFQNIDRYLVLTNPQPEKPAKFFPEKIDYQQLFNNIDRYLAQTEPAPVQPHPKAKKRRRSFLSKKLALPAAAALTALAAGLAPRPADSPLDIVSPARAENVLPPPEHPDVAIAAVSEIKPNPTPAPKKEIKVTREEFVGSSLVPALYQHALEIRQIRAQEEPEFLRRVDRKLNENRVNILFLGMGHEIDQPTDMIMILSYSLEDGTVQLFSIPRDLYAPEVDRFLTGSLEPQFHAINTAYSAGGYPLIRKAVEDLTALSADFTVRLELNGFIELFSRTLGEVEIDVREDFGDQLANVYLKKGKQKIGSEMLLRYLRARQSTSDYARAERQQEILEVLLKNFAEKLNSSSTFDKILQMGRLATVAYDLLSAAKLDSDTDIMRWLDLLKQTAINLPAAKFTGKDIYFQVPPMRRFVFDLTHGLAFAPKEATRIRPHLTVIRGGDYKAADVIEGYAYPFRRQVRDILLGPGA